ncbi:unnamed protein product [Didymodactylos carnosus]|uniref:Uncharacterized protein n=1 Tax=Didymodactylos carnosus TaxID=1234261 RepID=A0A8S2GC90_9BILA|nr:unnamed protein product [Didymodactylos carnosus]CAF4518345.1 unnamed protein product [Didymodactylos carnosus]
MIYSCKFRIQIVVVLKLAGDVSIRFIFISNSTTNETIIETLSTMPYQFGNGHIDDVNTSDAAELKIELLFNDDFTGDQEQVYALIYSITLEAHDGETLQSLLPIALRKTRPTKQNRPQTFHSKDQFNINE